MSTAQVNLFELKQEVNRRIAEHRSRKGAPEAGPRAVEAPQGGTSLRAAAAARVAQRFAHAPSYGDPMAERPRTKAMDQGRSAAAAARPADEPRAQAFERTAAGSAVKPQPAIEREEPHPVRHTAEPRQDARAGGRMLGGAAAAAIVEPPMQHWDGAIAVEEMPAAEADPIHGNLIEFPRELVATRKMRPRLAEAPFAAARDAQLSIFEVDPGTVSTEAAPAEAHPAAEWSQPEWSGIKLEADAEEEIAPAAVAAEIELAPVSRRLLALCVDASLIGAAVIAAGWMFVESSTALPGLRQMAMGALGAFVALGILYELLFFTLAQATPGMRYAHIGLWTFANQRPTREQRWRRLAATALSVLPLGLGLVWSLVDEERMCWHDRLSQTYLKSSF